jgi:hypothetical protein
VATLPEVEAQGWSLNPGRYVGTEVEELDDEVFAESSLPRMSSYVSWPSGQRSCSRASIRC